MIFDKSFKDIKKELFGTEDFVIHTVDINRPHKSKDPLNGKFLDRAFRAMFYNKISDLIEHTNFNCIAVVIQKAALVRYYEAIQNLQKDPYILSFGFLINRLLLQTKEADCCLYTETRNHILDLKLESERIKLKLSGTEYYK